MYISFLSCLEILKKLVVRPLIVRHQTVHPIFILHLCFALYFCIQKYFILLQDAAIPNTALKKAAVHPAVIQQPEGFSHIMLL